MSKDQKLLEIGGSYNPVFSKADGYDLYTADHDTQDNLVAKYRAYHPDPAAADRIQPVDFVVADGDLDRAIGEEHAGSFDIVFSSHNLEHIPNPIAHLRSIERILAPDGVFLVVVPDKRGCFDLLRPLSTAGQWIEAYLEPQPFHALRTLYDADGYSVASGDKIVWNGDEVFDGVRSASGLSVGDCLDLIRRTRATYRDAHAWVFTPHSCLLMLLEMNALGLVGLYPRAVLSDGNGEFVVELTKSRPVPIGNDRRVALLARACREQAEAHMRLPAA
ncbi:class I SAM-dependent methyltransferase [Methylobacterium trifolii]|uniref:class I SAM-dependent methyltransferase n=1 Tax=Methylobacterium trifolii TaxID=1003092 RepID=UPI001EDF61B3|nr:methyltransferase domain-containing protein [Methylobacterium trifolii]